MRTAARTDTNHTLVVNAFRDCYCSVQSLASIGAGCPDLLVGCDGVNLIVEVKDGNRAPSKRKLTPEQEIWHNAWRGSVHVVHSVQAALDLIAFTRQRLAR
jgi:hypothetical protein